MQSLSLFQLIWLNKISLLPLLICSLIVWVVVFERLLKFYKFESENEAFVKLFSEAWARDLREVDAALRTQNAALSFLVPSVEDLRAFHVGQPMPPSDLLAERMVSLRQKLVDDLKDRVWILGTIGSLSPFIGLFGTVVGIIKSFAAIGATGETGFAVVAAGISEALVATAVGILVAVIAMGFYNYLQIRIERLENVVTELSNQLFNVVVSPRIKNSGDRS